MLRKTLHLLVTIPFLIYIGCAKQTTPTGGPKDTVPPRLITSSPPPEAINFKGKKIDFTFSEFVVLNNPKEQLIITPSVGKDYEIAVKKKTVTLTLKKDLQPNTTYTINFRDAVADITEKNPVRNFQFAFSTGTYLDSLSIAGTIRDVLRGTPVADVTVAITPQSDTFDIFKHPATFFTKTNKNGNYRIDHLKPAEYFIYAIADKNKNLSADSKTESYGFIAQPIHVSRDTSTIDLGLVRLDSRPLKVTAARPYNTYFNIRTTKNLREYKLTSADGVPMIYCSGEDKSTIKLYNTIGEKDSAAFNFTALDSIGNYIDTVLYAKFSGREVEPEKFTMQVEPGSVIADKGTLEARIIFSKPVIQIFFDSIYYEIDSLTRVHFKEDDFTLNKVENTYTLKTKIDRALFPKNLVTIPDQPDTAQSTLVLRENLHLGNAAFISVEGDSTKPSNTKMPISNSATLSRIIYQFQTEDPVVVQLLNTNFNVVKQNFNRPKGEFENLQPGDYLVRVIIDTNKNQQWDPGNFYKAEEPEKIIYYIEPEKKSPKITLKANWDYDLAPMLITY